MYIDVPNGWAGYKLMPLRPSLVLRARVLAVVIDIIVVVAVAADAAAEDANVVFVVGLVLRQE